jgi:hypothetical protein
MLTNTISQTVYQKLIDEAQASANQIDGDVAVVIWGLAADGSVKSKTVSVPRRARGNDMTEVSKLLDAHEDAELLEIVGSNLA